jgi:hypothetical protein
MVIDTHSPKSLISSERSLAMYPSSWMHSSISAAVNGVLMMGLPVLVSGFRFEPSTISRDVAHFATFAEYSKSQLGHGWHVAPAPH